MIIFAFFFYFFFLGQICFLTFGDLCNDVILHYYTVFSHILPLSKNLGDCSALLFEGASVSWFQLLKCEGLLRFLQKKSEERLLIHGIQFCLEGSAIGYNQSYIHNLKFGTGDWTNEALIMNSTGRFVCPWF